MKLIKIQTPNGVELTALLFKSFGHINLCYAQNRIFTVFYVDNRDMIDPETGECGTEEYYYGEILVEYADIPEFQEYLDEDDSEDASSFDEEGYDEYLKSLEEKYIKEYMDEGYSREEALEKIYTGS